MVPKMKNQQRTFFLLVKQKRSDISLNTITHLNLPAMWYGVYRSKLAWSSKLFVFNNIEYLIKSLWNLKN